MNNLYDYFVNDTLLDVNFAKFYHGKQNYLNCNIESLNFEDKINTIETYFNNSNLIEIKLYYWEPDSLIQQYIKNFNYEFLLLKSYKGRIKPGVVLISLKVMDTVLIRNLLFNHFNKDFSRNPYLDIRPYFLIRNQENEIVLEVYDDRGFNVFVESILPTRSIE